MQFRSKLIKAILVRRYKRFLAEIILNTGQHVTAHCPNPGSMINLIEAGSNICVEKASNPKSKLPYAWRLLEIGNGTLVCIDTTIANKVIFEALGNFLIQELDEYTFIFPEIKIDKCSRLDFLLKGEGLPNCYVEVKSVTMLRKQNGIVEFPDSVTHRGAKHIRELRAIKKRGERAVLLYLINRGDANSWKIARDIDPAYDVELKKAISEGVEVLSYVSKIDLHKITLGKRIKMLEA